MFKNVHNTTSQGNIGMASCISWAVSKGWIVSIPLVDGQGYDLVIDTGNKLFRTQVRTSRYQRRGCYESKVKLDNTVDWLFILTEDGTRYLIPSYHLKSGQHKIWVSKNNLYKDFIV